MLKVIQPTSNAHRVKYPEGHESEFEVQAWLFNQLQAMGLEVKGEVQHRGAFGFRDAQASCRFDLVVYVNRAAVAIVEVKAARINHRRGLERTRQGSRYPTFGVPVLVVYGREGAEEAVSYFKAWPHDLG